MISTVRLYVLRAVYLMISIFLTSSFWPLLFHHTKACLMGVILVPAVLPWRYVFDTYLKAPGDRWR